MTLFKVCRPAFSPPSRESAGRPAILYGVCALHTGYAQIHKHILATHLKLGKITFEKMGMSSDTDGPLLFKLIESKHP